MGRSIFEWIEIYMAPYDSYVVIGPFLQHFLPPNFEKLKRVKKVSCTTSVPLFSAGFVLLWDCTHIYSYKLLLRMRWPRDVYLSRCVPVPLPCFVISTLDKTYAGTGRDHFILSPPLQRSFYWSMQMHSLQEGSQPVLERVFHTGDCRCIQNRGYSQLFSMVLE